MTIKIGIMDSKTFQKRTIDIAAGRYVPKSNEPKIWFSSMKSLAEVLSDSNRELIKNIAIEKPETIKELADITGREPSSLSRTLKTFEAYGFVEMVQNGRSKKPVAKSFTFQIVMPDYTGIHSQKTAHTRKPAYKNRCEPEPSLLPA